MALRGGGGSPAAARCVRTYVGQSDCDRVADSPGNLQTVSRLPQDAARAPPAGHLPPFPALSPSLSRLPFHNSACSSLQLSLSFSAVFSDSFRACTSASTPLRETSSTRSPDEQRPCQTLRILNFGCLGGPGSPGNHSGGPPRLPKSKISHPFKTNPTLPYVRNPTPAGSLAGMCWCHAWP